MDTLDGMRTIIAVVETGSFTAASERLGLSKALVSKYVAVVEKRLQVRLFNRTTRRLAVTEAGHNYYQQALPLLQEFNELEDSVGSDSASGLLRISAPVAIGEMLLAPKLPQFLQQQPNIQIELKLADRRINMLEEGIDIRLMTGTPNDSNLVAKSLGYLPSALCASNNYLQQHGTPQEPADLSQHSCIIDSNFRIGAHWPLTSKSGERTTVEVNSRIAANSPKAVKAIAVADGGIAIVPRFIIEGELNSGELTEVLPRYSSLEFGLHALYPHRRYLSKKVRAFIDFLGREISTR